GPRARSIWCRRAPSMRSRAGRPARWRSSCAASGSARARCCNTPTIPRREPSSSATDRRRFPTSWLADRLCIMMRGTCMLAVLLATCAGARGDPAVEFKSMAIVVGSSPGGGYDAYARMLARHLGRHLPGQPNVIVQNMPGASGLKAVQYLDANAPKDGSMMAAFNPGLITESLL